MNVTKNVDTLIHIHDCGNPIYHTGLYITQVKCIYHRWIYIMGELYIYHTSVYIYITHVKSLSLTLIATDL